MPELPEVETVRRGLEALIVGKTIERVTVTLGRIIRKPDDVEQFKLLLQDLTIDEVKRRGKYLLIGAGPYTLVSHLRMEGRYGLYSAEEAVEKHTHVIFHFTDGTELRYKDVRQFGTMDLLPRDDFTELPGVATLGPEPLHAEFTVDALRRQVAKRRSGKIKALLLDQTFVAGLGNIYVDEVLFVSGIHPETTVTQLTDLQVTRLQQAIVDVLDQSVRLGGSSIKSYVNGYGQGGMMQHQLRVYGHENEPCPQCGTEIVKTRVAGRGTHFCPHCQPEQG
ncbi:DNA-formamidopyrimidine glycosylase [Tumebacillus permanentifrigoris]|uniref:Formamidopyrimidine-DNA glycosylase n=1 Tax=Tumebacillus permanentifrigoris TaxID=378543 RepID=A0A316DB93_9BACL|nr:DNA-formamidopyrimidine glycosylase [Tumebacillus permanentifrigoris]PWK13886.1 DNA-(apurinic or apyrimidinic site) lyase [Tumebacillus permanentifrigoris]